MQLNSESLDRLIDICETVLNRLENSQPQVQEPLSIPPSIREQIQSSFHAAGFEHAPIEFSEEPGRHEDLRQRVIRLWDPDTNDAETRVVEATRKPGGIFEIQGSDLGAIAFCRHAIAKLQIWISSLKSLKTRLPKEIRKTRAVRNRDSSKKIAKKRVSKQTQSKSSGRKLLTDDDDSAYVPAKSLREAHAEFMTPSDVTKLLEKCPEIRRIKPNKRVLLIHAGDWLRYWEQRNRIKLEALGDESLQDTITEIEARKEKARARKSGK